MTNIADLFLITSVICTGNQSWSYCKTRSIFNPEERLEQTLQTIESIRNLKDDSKILLVECSDIDPTTTSILKDKVDYFLQTYDQEDIRQACLFSHKKGYGEVKQTQYACKYIESNSILFNRLFKISGRYFLNSRFDKLNYSIDKFSFKMYSTDSGCTVLYSVPYIYFKDYKKHLDFCNEFYQTHPPTGLENLLPCISLPRHDIVQYLGVSGYVAIPDEDTQKPDFFSM
jgi:hypothetical protein